MKPIPKVPPLPDYATNKIERASIHMLLLSDDREKWKVHLYERCKRDFTFWANHFAFAYLEQEVSDKKEAPLVMYDFQGGMAEDIIGNIWRCINDTNERWNCGADKARKMTATFTGLLVVQWFAQFHGVSTVITSKTLDDVDVLEDMNSPFERLRWQIARMYRDFPWLFPSGFVPDDKRCMKRRLLNFGNGGQIAGVAPNGKSMRQARAVIWLGDEFGFVEKDYVCFDASSATIKVRMLFSTPNGPNCLFAKLVDGEATDEQQEPVQFHLYELDWWLHPEYAQGLYYRPDGQLSSPYFDQVMKTNREQTIAKDYLRDHNESVGGMVFNRQFRKLISCVKGLGPDSYVRTIYCIWDPGVHFGISFWQRDRWDRFLGLYELYDKHDNVPRGHTLLEVMAMRAKAHILDHYEGFSIVHLGDPYGAHIQNSTQKLTEYQLLEKKHEIRVHSAYMRKIPTQVRIDMRVELLRDLMANDVEVVDEETGAIEMTPQLLINPDTMPRTVKAFAGKYRYEVDDDGTVTNKIVKVHPYTEMADTAGMGAIKIFRPNADSDKDNIKRLANQRKKRVEWRPTGGRMRNTSRYA